MSGVELRLALIPADQVSLDESHIHAVSGNK